MNKRGGTGDDGMGDNGMDDDGMDDDGMDDDGMDDDGMDGTGMGELSCGEFAEVAAELALGVLTGRERAAALAHLDRCEPCRELVRELTITGDELLALLPSSEPSAGFEVRVLDRLGLAERAGRADQTERAYRADRLGRTTPSRHRRDGGRRADRRTDRPAGRARDRLGSVLTVAAVVAAVAAAGLGGWGLRAATAPTVQAPAQAAPSSPLSSAALVADDASTTVGQAFLYNRAPSWVYMSVGIDGLGNVTVKCQLEASNGRFTTVGEFRLDDGYGAWGSPYAASQGPVIGARLLGANGTVLAIATFR